MTSNAVGSYHIDRGLERVLPFHTGNETRLPAANKHLLPPEVTPNKHLEQLLRAPDVQQLLLENLKDEIGDPDLLLPGVHRDMLKDTGAALESLTAGSTDPEARKILNRASNLLRGELDLVDLLDHYRAALHKA